MATPGLEESYTHQESGSGHGQESFFKLLFENNPLPMWVYDTQSLRFLMVNHAAVMLYGFSKDEFLQKTIEDIRPQDQLPLLKQELATCRDDLNKSGEWVHQKRDGALIDVEISSHVLPPENGVPRRLVVVHDITARKRAEAQVKEVENRAQSILSNIVEIVFSFNHRMEMIFVSPQCQSILGYSQEEFYADKNLWFSLVHPQDRYLFEEALPKIKKTNKQFKLEYRIKTATGEERWFITRCSAILDENGQMDRIDGSANDITERVIAEEKLRFADFSIERASEGFVWFQANARVSRVNKAICELLGYTEQEFLGLSLFDIAPRLGSENWEAYWQELVTLKHKQSEARLRAKNGNSYLVEMHWNYFRYNNNEYSFTSVGEIGDRKKAEAEKARLTEETIRQNEHLQQFAYIVSHNLRAPVANIVGLTSLYNRRDPADPINAVLINKLERTSVRLDDTIKDLNEILTIRSKEDQGREIIDLKEILADVRDSLGPQLSRENARLLADFSNGSLVVGVGGYINSIFLNLISNAIKYRHPHRNLLIEIKTVFSDGGLCLLVQDNGIGIDLEKQRHRVFGLYRRFHPHIEGKGLGLHMVKTQVETMGGWVDLDSVVGEGSTFKIFFQAPPKK
ncbi:MAG: PAS domain-containing sensor histidine kinase [Rufibacter sp.]